MHARLTQYAPSTQFQCISDEVSFLMHRAIDMQYQPDPEYSMFYIVTFMNKHSIPVELPCHSSDLTWNQLNSRRTWRWKQRPNKCNTLWDRPEHFSIKMFLTWSLWPWVISLGPSGATARWGQGQLLAVSVACDLLNLNRSYFFSIHYKDLVCLCLYSVYWPLDAQTASGMANDMPSEWWMTKSI